MAESAGNGREKTTLSIPQSLKRRAWSKSQHKAPPDYTRCSLNKKEYGIILMQSAFLVTAAAYFLYRSVFGVIALTPLGIWWVREKKREYAAKRRQELCGQFREMLLAVAASLQAGYSVENAFGEARSEMTALYGAEADIVKELSILSNAIKNGIPAEQILFDFGSRSGVEEIRDFAQIFRNGKRLGADMGDMIGHTVKLISEKMDTAREIHTVMSAKVMEQRVMSMVPFGIMSYIGLTSPGFFEGLYHNVPGVLFMSGCLFLYLGAVKAARRIVKIEV